MRNVTLALLLATSPAAIAQTYPYPSESQAEYYSRMDALNRAQLEQYTRDQAAARARFEEQYQHRFDPPSFPPQYQMLYPNIFGPYNPDAER